MDFDLCDWFLCSVRSRFHYSDYSINCMQYLSVSLPLAVTVRPPYGHGTLNMHHSLSTCFGYNGEMAQIRSRKNWKKSSVRVQTCANCLHHQLTVSSAGPPGHNPYSVSSQWQNQPTLIGWFWECHYRIWSVFTHLANSHCLFDGVQNCDVQPSPSSSTWCSASTCSQCPTLHASREISMRWKAICLWMCV